METHGILVTFLFFLPLFSAYIYIFYTTAGTAEISPPNQRIARQNHV